MSTLPPATLDAIASADARLRAAFVHLQHLAFRGVSARKQAAAKRELRAARMALRALVST